MFAVSRDEELAESLSSYERLCSLSAVSKMLPQIAKQVADMCGSQVRLPSPAMIVMMYAQATMEIARVQSTGHVHIVLQYLQYDDVVPPMLLFAWQSVFRQIVPGAFVRVRPLVSGDARGATGASATSGAAAVPSSAAGSAAVATAGAAAVTAAAVWGMATPASPSLAGMSVSLGGGGGASVSQPSQGGAADKTLQAALSPDAWRETSTSVFDRVGIVTCHLLVNLCNRSARVREQSDWAISRLVGIMFPQVVWDRRCMATLLQLLDLLYATSGQDVESIATSAEVQIPSRSADKPVLVTVSLPADHAQRAALLSGLTNISQRWFDRAVGNGAGVTCAVIHELVRTSSKRGMIGYAGRCGHAHTRTCTRRVGWRSSRVSRGPELRPRIRPSASLWSTWQSHCVAVRRTTRVRSLLARRSPCRLSSPTRR